MPTALWSEYYLCKGSSEYTKKFLAMLYNEEETNVMAHNTYEVKFIL